MVQVKMRNEYAVNYFIDVFFIVFLQKKFEVGILTLVVQTHVDAHIKENSQLIVNINVDAASSYLLSGS